MLPKLQLVRGVGTALLPTLFFFQGVGTVALPKFILLRGVGPLVVPQYDVFNVFVAGFAIKTVFVRFGRSGAATVVIVIECWARGGARITVVTEQRFCNHSILIRF